MYTYRFDWEGLALPVHQATLQYVAGVDPELRWRKRGLKSHDKDTEAESNLRRALLDANQYLETEEGQQRLGRFMSRVVELFHDLLTDPDWIQTHFPDQEFFFIMGPMRSGGTYLLTEMCSLFDVSYRRLHFRMLHDSIPTPEFLTYHTNPRSWLPLLFEMAQFLTWSRDVFPGGTVVKKRIQFAHALPVLDALFGARARYFVCVRHPAGVAASSSELLETFHTTTPKPDEQGWDRLVQNRRRVTREQWEELSYEERVLQYWQTFYLDICRTGPVQGRLETVVFGEDSDSVLRNLAGEFERDYQPRSFEPKEREFDPYWSSETVSDVLKRVEEAWKLYDMKWPSVPLR